MSRVLRKTSTRLSFITNKNIFELHFRDGEITLFMEVDRKLVTIDRYNDKNYTQDDLELFYDVLSVNV